MKLPIISSMSDPTKKGISEFLGYNAQELISDGEMREMENLSSDNYPMLSPRPMRKSLYPYTVHAIMSYKTKIALIRTSQAGVVGLYYDNMDTAVMALNSTLPKQMVSIANKIVIFPDKVYYNVDAKESGALGLLLSFAHSTNFNIFWGKYQNPNDATEVYDYIRVKFVGATYEEPYISQLEALEGFTGIDTLQLITTGVFNEQAMASAVVPVYGASNYVELRFPANTISQYFTLVDIGSGYLEAASTTNSKGVSIERKTVDLDFVLEKNNRLWGCNSADNTIYGCRLGDPTNWFQYQALATDSYAVQVASDGAFTGISATASQILFFKEGCIHKLYGGTPSTFEVVTAEVYSVEAGSSNSIAVINNTVFYKSHLGIMAYDGYEPQLISQVFGNVEYSDAVAGTDGVKYFVSLKDKSGKWNLFVLDYIKKLWHREDASQALAFCFHNSELLMCIDKQILTLHDDGDIEFRWRAVFGDFYEQIENKKTYSKFYLRAKMPAHSEISIGVSYDGDDYQAIYHKVFKTDEAVMIPVMPRRCDKLRIEVSGKGDFRIEKLVRSFTVGSVK